MSALSAPRIQAGKVNGSECTFSKPATFSLASAHPTARLWASVPARRCPISVVSDCTKSKAAGSLSAFCPRLDAVTANELEGNASVALVVVAALAVRAATMRVRKICSSSCSFAGLSWFRSLRVVFNPGKATVKFGIAQCINLASCARLARPQARHQSVNLTCKYKFVSCSALDVNSPRKRIERRARCQASLQPLVGAICCP